MWCFQLENQMYSDADSDVFFYFVLTREQSKFYSVLFNC